MPKYVMSVRSGADMEKIPRCRRIRCLSMPSWSRKLTKPNAAGALCSMIARKTIISTSWWLVLAAAPSATPSAAACTTKPIVAVEFRFPSLPSGLWLLRDEIWSTSIIKTKPSTSDSPIVLEKSSASWWWLCSVALSLACSDFPFAYSERTPSGMITIRAVPTSNPAPSTDTIFNLAWISTMKN